MEEIRAARRSDVPSLAQLRWDFRSARGGVAEREAEFVSRCAAWMSDALENDRWECFVAEIDGALVGHLWIQLIEKIPNPSIEREHHAYITNVYVQPEQRGAGIAARLLDAAHAWCADRDVDTIVLWPSEKSRPLYARHGFAATDAILAHQIR